MKCATLNRQNNRLQLNHLADNMLIVHASVPTTKTVINLAGVLTKERNLFNN